MDRQTHDGITWWGDEALLAEGVRVALSERTGGVSNQPYASLNLAGHVGDDPFAVDENRRRLMGALGLGESRDRLVTAEQVHGERIERIDLGDAGRGAFVTHGPIPVAATDALITDEPGVPVALFFADCVPVILVAPGPVVGVVHAGWRGALASLPGKTVAHIVETWGVSAGDVRAYVGAHIRACHYEVSDDVLSQFVNSFDTVARAESGGLDLAAVVTESLIRSGVDSCNIARVEVCTAEATDRFFSYRAEQGVTGRHCALACILP